MISRKPLFLLLVIVASIAATLLACVGARRVAVIHKQPQHKQVLIDRIAKFKNHSPKGFGKIRIPADVFVDLASPSNPFGPVTILISVSSQIPIHLGIVTLKVPPIGDSPDKTEVLWSGAPLDFVDETAEYTMDNLPAGKFRFIVIFEFATDSANAEKLFISKSLYLDVRPTKILSSNVSFDQIKRVELWNELEQLVLTDLKQNSADIGLKTVARNIVTSETLDSSTIESRITELKASDPEVARRIMELNRVKLAPTEASQSVEISQKSQQDMKRMRVKDRPAIERAVPIPERYRDQ